MQSGVSAARLVASERLGRLRWVNRCLLRKRLAQHAHQFIGVLIQGDRPAMPVSARNHCAGQKSKAIAAYNGAAKAPQRSTQHRACRTAGQSARNGNKRIQSRHR